MGELVQRYKREFQSFKNVDELISFLKAKFQNIKLYVSHTSERFEVMINEYLDDKSILILTDETFPPVKNFSIYGLADKYIEIDLQTIEIRAPGYILCRIKAARKAATGRKGLRFKLEENEAFATNFKISTQTVNVTDYKIPTTVKVLLDQFKSENSKLADIIDVDVFQTNEVDPIINKMRKTNKNVLISDTSDSECYKALNDNFMDIMELYGKNLPALIKHNIEKGYKSMVIVPIIDMPEAGPPRSFGYIKLISKTVQSDIDIVYDMKEKSLQLIDKIRDANTKTYTIRQEILDISREGVRIKITDETLKKLMLKTVKFVFDIVFKFSAPITIYGEIKSTYKSQNILSVGVDFTGNSSRKDEMKRLYEILGPMEISYKTNLIKKIKSQG